MFLKLWTIVIICFFMVSYGYSSEKDKQKMITVTGKIIRIVAIGAETTGWAVDLDSPVQINDKKTKRIEIDPGENKTIDRLENKRVKIVGALEKRKGIERKEYWVIKANKIQTADNAD